MTSLSGNTITLLTACGAFLLLQLRAGSSFVPFSMSVSPRSGDAEETASPRLGTTIRALRSNRRRCGVEAVGAGRRDDGLGDRRFVLGRLDRRAASTTSSSSDPGRDDFSSAKVRRRERANLGGRLPIISRTVPLGIAVPGATDGGGGGHDGGLRDKEEGELCATVWELERPSELVELWWSSPEGSNDRETIGDPFGVVVWPGSIVAAQELALRRSDVVGKTVLVVGAGTGVEAQAAAMLGAGKVLATDVNKMALRLLEYGAERAGLSERIETRVFDVFSNDPLPQCDVVVAADVLYNARLASQIGRRCEEILSLDGSSPKLIVTDSQRFHGTDFLSELNRRRARRGEGSLVWEERTLEGGFTGSGVLVEGDQTYDVTARLLTVGWDDK